MFADQHFAPQHFAPQHFPPVLDIEPHSGGGGGIVRRRSSGFGLSGFRAFVPVEKKREQIKERLEAVEPKLSAKAKRRLLTGLEIDSLDIRALEAAIAHAVVELPPRRRVVDPPIERADITLPAPVLDPLGDDLNLRLLLLLGC